MAPRLKTSERVHTAAIHLLKGNGGTATVAYVAESQGLSRRQAQRITARAYALLVADLEEMDIDRHEMLSQLIGNLQAAIASALETRQPAAAVAGVRCLAELVRLTPSNRRP